jgi:hypothetical protein
MAPRKVQAFSRRQLVTASSVALAAPAMAGATPMGPDARRDGDSDLALSGHGTALQDTPRAGLSVTEFGARGDDATDNARALLSAIRAAHAAKVGELFLPAGTYRSSAALDLPSGLVLRGAGKGASFLKFTGPTDGIVVSDAHASVGLRDLTLVTNNTGARSALRFANKQAGASNSLIDGVDISVEGGEIGRWDYGIWATNWQNSRVNGVRIAYGCDVGIHLEFGCNATVWSAVEVVGFNRSRRGVEMFGYDTSAASSFDSANAASRNTFENYWYGLTIQGGLADSCFYIEGAAAKVFGCHPENTDPAPRDGADVVIVGGGVANATFAGLQGGSVRTSGAIRNLTFTQSELATVTIGAGTFGGMYGCRFTSLADNSGGAWDVVSSSLGVGNSYPTILNNAVVANAARSITVTRGAVELPALPTARVTLNAASPVTLANLTGGVDGQSLVIGFGDTNCTLRTIGNLRIGTDFRPSSTDARLVLEKDGANWVQLSRFAG